MNVFKNRSQFPFLILYGVLFIIGLIIYKDYGISWDESVQRTENGYVNYNYMHNDDYKSLMEGNEKYHGPAFEIVLVYIEKFLDLKMQRDIFLMRHLVTFLTFFLSVLFFYLICLKQFKSYTYGFIGALMLVLSPRIFADAFYNSKDLVFMSLVIINIYATICFIERKNIKTAFAHALISAFVIDTRVLGIIIPAFTWLVLFTSWIKGKSDRKKIIISTCVNVITMAGFIILFWPVLWKDPLGNFIKSLQEMSHYHWDSYMLYLGKRADALHLPWHYIPVWMIISIPLLYLALFFFGLIGIVRKVIREKTISFFDSINLYIFFLPLLAIIFLHSVVYDGWRHVFFIYPSMLLIALSGLYMIFENEQFNKKLIKLAKWGIGIYFLFIAYVMFDLHPYENVYFNSIPGSSIQQIRKNFEIDYWGLSYKEGIEHILKIDTSSHIIIAPDENPGRDNLRIFTDEQRARFSITANVELADYFLTTYRYHHEPFLYNAEFNVVRNGGVICSVFDLRRKRIRLEGENFRSAAIVNNYENGQNMTGGKIIAEPGAHNTIEEIDSTMDFGGGITFSPPKILLNDELVGYISIKFKLKSPTPWDARIVIQFDSGNAVMYGWEGNDLQSSLTNTWLQQDFRLMLPKIYSENDKIKIYVWNFRKKNFYVDDFEINFYSIPDEMFHRVLSTLPEGEQTGR